MDCKKNLMKLLIVFLSLYLTTNTLLANKYDCIIVSVISPLEKTRKYAYKIFKENYFEIYVFASIKILEKRDTKGLYDLSKKGLINNLIGHRSKINYEKSNHKHLRINTNILSLENSLTRILSYAKINL